MINTTDRPILLMDGGKLDQEVRRALSWAEALLREQQKDTKARGYEKAVFAKFVGEENRRPDLFDERFVQAAYDFASSDAVNTATQPAMEQMAEYLFKRTVAATGFAFVKRGIKLTLVELWRRGVLMLTTIFTPGPQFSFSAYDHEILRWLLSFDPNSTAGDQKTDTRRLYYYGPRLLLATDWTSFEDVSINDIAELNLAQRFYERGEHPYAIAGSTFPWSQLPAALMKRHPQRVSFDQTDLVKYSAWAAKQAVSRGALEAFVIGQVPAKQSQSRVRPSPRSGAIPTSKTKKRDLAVEAKSASTHDAVLAVFKCFMRRPDSVNWRQQVPSYPGREHIELAPICEKWVHSFKAFLYHREHIQGYRSSDEVVASLNMLADYLFLYLPWWRELHPAGAVHLPRAPKDFVRYAYVSRHDDEPIDTLPVPLLRLIRLRRPKAESAAICIRHLTLYFRFVGAHFGDDESIAGASFRNPLDDEFDAPRLPGKKNRTNKEIIPRNIYGHLLFWCYAVEAFGELLLQQALKGSFEQSWWSMRGARRYDAEALGIAPIFRFRGKEVPVRSVPNVFTWAEREILCGDQRVAVVVPHLTALRLLIVSLETGLRCQSVQWLDRTTWDSLNKGAGEQYTYRLLVNTDKTKVESWAPPVVFRVRNVMQREVAFQELFADFDTFDPVPYEGLANSPFDPVRPLFKSSKSGRPIHDDVYFDAWIALLVDFEAFYKEVSGERHVRLYYLKPQKTRDGQPVVKFTGREANAYCGISVLAVHTPHSCRATFATNRQGQGILELSDVAALLGHEDIATTTHYTKFSGEQLQERLQQSDVELLGDYSIFDVGFEGVHIRPDKPDSALVKSFSKNREGTVAAFKFMPSLTLWSIEDEKLNEHNGLELLKGGPMSHIRFRETHICPVGEECPSDIVERIGAPKRCGICPLAMKCIDHLPAISAKRNQLVERVRYLHGQRGRMEVAREPAPSLDAVWDEIQLDINELLGWRFSEEVLRGMLAEIEQSGDSASYIHVERPDIVRRHLLTVTRKCDRTEFLLQRLAESNAYPSMTSPQVQLAASVLRRR
ncbi:site-specific integrase, partial [Variovorax beijingensis]